MKTKLVKPLVYILSLSVVVSLVVTLVYLTLPSFKVYSFNYAIVPSIEQSDQFSYNGYYQGEVSKTIVSSLQLFSAGSDFKQKVETELNSKVLYLMSKTFGANIISIKLVSTSNINVSNAEGVLKTNLQNSLNLSTPQNLNITINSLNDYNSVYTNLINPYKFFIFVFSTVLIFFSLIFLLKQYFYE